MASAFYIKPYLSGGTKDIESSSMIIEPLARYNETGALVPFLAEEIPTVANGGVSDDLKSITWKLKSGLKWSDGSAVTSADVKFTGEYCMDPDGGCAQLEKFDGVTDIATPDDRTIVVSFSAPKPNPYGPFVGGQTPILQKKQLHCKGAKAQNCTAENFGPIGTGPFVVTEFKPNDVIQMKANDNYRDPNKTGFCNCYFWWRRATAAGRSVLETGEFDYAWNLQLAPEVIANMEKAGKGVAIAVSTLVERLEMNMTDPSPSLDADTGQLGKHLILS